MDCWETVHFFYFISKKPLYLCTQKPEVEDNWSGSWITHVTFRKNSERIPKEFRKNSERIPKELRKNSEGTPKELRKTICSAGRILYY